MTEAEALEVAGIFGGNAITAFATYITFTMAYLVAAYYAGDKLTVSQSLTASLLYLFAAVSAVLSMISNVAVYGQAMKTTEMASQIPLANGGAWAIGMSVLMSVGILISFYFMWSVRHPKTERPL